MDMKQWFQTHWVRCSLEERRRVREVIAAYYPDDDFECISDEWEDDYKYVKSGTITDWTLNALTSPPHGITEVSVDEFCALFGVPSDDISELPDISEII